MFILQASHHFIKTISFCDVLLSKQLNKYKAMNQNYVFNVENNGIFFTRRTKTCNIVLDTSSNLS